MKKINLFELLSIGIIILISCILISFAAKNMLNIDADFLSAAATFFAGVVAYLLFNDWRDQYKIELLERLMVKIDMLFNDLDEGYDKLYEEVMAEDLDKIIKNVGLLSNTIDRLNNEIYFYQKIFDKFNLINQPCFVLPENINKDLGVIKAKITMSDIEDEDAILENDNYLRALTDYFESHEGMIKIVELKGLVIDDMQKFILILMDAKEGH